MEEQRTLLDVLADVWRHAVHGINWSLLYNELGYLGRGAGISLVVTVIAVAIGVVVGLTLAFMRRGNILLRIPAAIYTEGFRCTPMLVQLLLFYFGVFPGLQEFNTVLDLLPSIDFARLPAVYSGTLVLGLNSGAYLGEIFRGGIQSIDKGQREAALSLGMRNYQVMYYVVLPQALANALPAVGNEFITMIKDSSLLSILAVAELTFRANQVGARTFEFFTMYLGIGLIYFAICFPTSRIMAYVEKRMRVGHK